METDRDDFVIAIRSAFLKKGNQQKFSLLSLILFSIIFLVLGNFDFKIVKFNRSVIKEIIYYSSFVVTVPENVVKKTANKVSNHFEYYDDYQKTKSKLEVLQNKDLTKKIIIYENLELKKLIQDYFVEDSQVYAKILIDKKSPFLRSIIINKGSKNDVKLGMAVYDDIYLIGKVVEVNFLTSRVLLISDINSKVPVTIQPINVQAIMIGLEKQKGKLQYIRDEKFNNIANEELVVVTSGSGGVFKSGIPIGKINTKVDQNNNEIIVDFFRDFSQLKYVRILSHKKVNTDFTESSNKTFKATQENILKYKSQKEDIKILQQQQIITKEVRNKLEEENSELKINLINIQKKLSDEKKKQKENYLENDDIKFLQLNLLFGHKCRKTFIKSSLYKIGTPEYKACVLNKGRIKKN
tara:strand:+ start:60 stop:1289 length:1230 start_codon:yes stop_codon:yes gene_type:complete